MYKARADVNAVLHSHALSVLPFTITQVPMRGVLHDSAFLGSGPSVYDANKDGSNGTLLITSMKLAEPLAADLGKQQVILIKGHGDVVVDTSIPKLVAVAYYIEKNSKALMMATALGGPISSLTPDEVAARAKLKDERAVVRPWPMWKALYGKPLAP